MQKLTMGEAEFRNLAHAVGGLELFASFKGAELDLLLAHVQLFEFSSGETIFTKGQRPDAFYIIDQGRVAIRFKSGLFWLFRKVRVLGESNLFGEMALLENRPHSGTAIARGRVRLFVVLREDFEKIVRSNPAFAQHMRWIASNREFEKRH